MNLKTYALALTLIGCSYLEDPPKHLEGKVVRETGTAVHLVESSGAIFGNESVRLGDLNYILTVDVDSAKLARDNGRYTIDVQDDYKKPLIALAEAIEPGSRIRFRVTEGGVHSFSNDKIGSIDSTLIEILGR